MQPPSRRSPPPNWRGAHCAHCWDAAHKQEPQHRCNTIMDLAAVFSVARVRSAPMHDRIQFLAPSSGRCSRRRSVSVLGTLPHCLRLPRPFRLSSLRARRCFPRSAPSPANAWLRTDCWLLPKSIVGEMCAAPPPWPPARPTLRVLWWPAGGDLQRMQALKRGPRHVVANIAFRVAQDVSHSAPAPSPPPTPTLPYAVA
jgi:hypothetical protein